MRTLSLTGTAFLVLLGVLTIAAFVVLIVYWTRFGGSAPHKVAARTGMLVLVNVLVLLTVATQLNDTYLFFASWTDLKGAFTGSVTQTSLDRGTSAAKAVTTSIHGVRARSAATLPRLSPSRFNAAGVASFTVKGKASGIVGTVLVQLPPGYFKAGSASKRYPVLETFSGYPGAPDQWINTMNLGGVMANEVALGHMRPALIVSPQIEVPPGVDTECVNGRSGYPQVETWLTRDVPNWVARTFRIRPSRSSWATIGLSAGGWCAAMATFLHPAQYAAAIVMGGYFKAEFGPAYEAYPPWSPLAARYDLVPKARHHPAPVAIWLETSHTDAVSYRSSAAFLTHARPPLAIHAVVLQHAGHRIGLWQALLPEALRWLGSSVPGFR